MSRHTIAELVGPGEAVSGSGYPSLSEHPSLYPGIPQSLDRSTDIAAWPSDYLLFDGSLWPLATTADADLGKATVGPQRAAGVAQQPTLSEVLELLGLPALLDRIPVIAVGSNAYPRQLVDKFGEGDPDAGVPAFRGILSNASIAYCPRIASKGYVPVTPTYSLGEESVAWLQLLTPDQLAPIIRSERPYLVLACSKEDTGVGFEVAGSSSELDEVILFWHSTVLVDDQGTPTLCKGTVPARRARPTLSQRALTRSLGSDRPAIDAALSSRAAPNPAPPASRQAHAHYPRYGSDTGSSSAGTALAD